MRTALIFHGPQGAGKNLFFEAYAAIFGKYSRIVGQAEIDDKFNDWASGKLFMIADEVVARQELFHIKNKLKALITGETIRINPKNVAAHDERNHVNIVFLSNEKQPLVLEKDDRRYMVIWTPEKLSKNVYADIAEEIAAGGIEALHDYLLHLDLGDFNQYTEPLITASKQDLIDINLESGERFIADWLGGDLDLPVCPCMSEDLYRAYNDWCKRNGVARPRELNQFVGNIAKTKGFKRERARIHKDFTFTSDLIQRNVICPPAEKYQETHQLSNFKNSNQWFTTCVLDFKESLRGNNDQNN
jgi:putative DNA primase/helicase